MSDFKLTSTLDPDPEVEEGALLSLLYSYAITSASLTISGCVLKFSNSSGSVLSSFILAPKV